MYTTLVVAITKNAQIKENVMIWSQAWAKIMLRKLGRKSLI
jgi:hypothetical protein